MDSTRNPYTPPLAILDGRPHGLQPPLWPHVQAPYLIPSHLMLWGLVVSPVLTPLGLGGISSLSFFLGLFAWVYAYRKQPACRKAERMWWADLRWRQKVMAGRTTDTGSTSK
jgi:hypothetical protein